MRLILTAVAQAVGLCVLIVHTQQAYPPCHVLGSRRREDSSLETAASGRDSYAIDQ
jgi:hypothetical protein